MAKIKAGVAYGPSRFSVGARTATAIGRVMREGTNDDDKGGGGGDSEALKAEKAKTAKAVEESKKLRERLKKLEDAEEAREAEKKAAEEEAQKKAGEFDKIEAKLKDDIKKANDRADAAEAKYTGLVVDTGLRQELQEAGVDNPVFQKAALGMIKTGQKFDIADDGSISVAGSPLKDFVGNWAGTDEGKSFVTNGSGGGGAPNKPGGGAAPKNVTPNMGGSREERQAALLAKHPELGQSQ